MSDSVNHPDHYCKGGVECIEVIKALGWHRPYCLGNALKYIYRCETKGRMREDLQKAVFYLNAVIATLPTECQR